jgi:hypothetical protein
MIEGLRIEMTGEDLVRKIGERIMDHERQSADWELRVKAEDLTGKADPDTPRHMLEHQRDEHLEQAEFLTLLRDHLVRAEVYRLNADDLRMADLLPDRVCW